MGASSALTCSQIRTRRCTGGGEEEEEGGASGKDQERDGPTQTPAHRGAETGGGDKQNPHPTPLGTKLARERQQMTPPGCPRRGGRGPFRATHHVPKLSQEVGSMVFLHAGGPQVGVACQASHENSRAACPTLALAEVSTCCLRLRGCGLDSARGATQ